MRTSLVCSPRLAAEQLPALRPLLCTEDRGVVVTTASVGCPLCGSYSHTETEHSLPRCLWFAIDGNTIVYCDQRGYHGHDAEPYPEADQ